jgi:hypothetical protein
MQFERFLFASAISLNNLPSSAALTKALAMIGSMQGYAANVWRLEAIHRVWNFYPAQ